MSEQKGVKLSAREKCFLSPRDLTRYRARKAGENDRDSGRPADPSRYGALPRSAWADWYREGFNS